MAADGDEPTAPRDELWRLAILVDGTALDKELTKNPMRLLAWFTEPLPVPEGRETALVLAKISLLQTFDNVHEYQTKKGVQLRAANTARCRYPHVTLASCLHRGSDQEPVLSQMEPGISLDSHTGLARPTKPTLLLASPAFLATHGYSHLELVWVQLATPLPIERVVVSGAAGKIALTPVIIDEAMQELASLVKKEMVILRQGTTFSLAGQFSVGEEGKRHSVLQLTILETWPVCQGQLSTESEVVVVPAAEEEEEMAPRQAEKSLSLSSLPLEISGLEESTETKSLTASNCSASDFRNEEEEPNSDPMLEVLTHPELCLHRNYVLVPRQFASDHKLLQYQMVVLERASPSATHSLEDMVVSIQPAGREGDQKSHVAILMWYEGQAELERYLPPPYPGYQYHEAVLQCAFLHPHLLFFLFPETLSPSRRYSVTVKVSHSNPFSLSHMHTHTHTHRLAKERKMVSSSFPAIQS